MSRGIREHAILVLSEHCANDTEAHEFLAGYGVGYVITHLFSLMDVPAQKKVLELLQSGFPLAFIAEDPPTEVPS
jgi:hypothetical protein